MFCGLLLFFSVVLLTVQCKDYFGFPEPESPTGIKKRVPLFVPERCPGNQLLYPGDHEADWICDCGPGFIFHPTTDLCYAIYKQGPCAVGEHLVLPKAQYIPECVRNPCKEGSAKYMGTCYEMDKAGAPCKPVNEGGGIFGINVTTLEAGCLFGYDWHSISEMNINCPPGSRRDNKNRCRHHVKATTDD